MSMSFRDGTGTRRIPVVAFDGSSPRRPATGRCPTTRHEEAQGATQGCSGSEASRVPEEEEQASTQKDQKGPDSNRPNFLSNDEVLRLQDYEPGKDMGKDWYDWRIMHLVDRVNYLTDLLDHHQIPHSLVEFSKWQDVGLSQQRADLARDALIEDADRPSLVEFGLSQHPEV